jgi:3-oxoacyl-[acyl-carrier protein] reductase
MTRAMAWSLGARGVRVNSLSPGLTATPHITSLIDNEPALSAHYLSLHATDRFNAPADIAEIAAFLLSDASIALTGTDLLADNGMSARLFHRAKPLQP